MYTLLAIIIVIASVLLTIVVLLQNSKGGGLASNFNLGNQTLGVRQAADVLEKATWIFAIVIMICCVLATAAISGRQAETKSDLTKKIQNQSQPVGQPSFPIENATSAPEETPSQPSEETAE